MRRFVTSLVAVLALSAPAAAAGIPTVGDAAPSFSLPSDRNEIVTLADFKGKKAVVLAFYPKNETPGCTTEMQAFSKDLPLFDKAGAMVFGISVDSVKAHKDFILNCALAVPLLSDEGGKVAASYGAKMPLVGLAKRKTFIIDKAGIIRHIVDGMPNNQALISEIAKLK